jgi:ATP-dependent RNA helicase DHX57
MKAYEGWYEVIKSQGMRAARSFCEENYLSFATLNEVQNLRRQYTDALVEIGFYKKSNHEHYNINSENVNLLKSILFAGLNPNVAKIQLPDTKYDKVLSGTVEREKEAREIKYFTKDDGKIFFCAKMFSLLTIDYRSGLFTSIISVIR